MALDSLHTENFMMMLRSLSMTPFAPVGLVGALGIQPQSASTPMTPEGAFAEASTIQDLAYGATLGLVYYRCLGPPLRAKWDERIAQSIERTRTTLSQNLGNACNSWLEVARSRSQPNTATRATQKQLSDVAQTSRRQLDFLMALQAKKGATFAGTTDDVVNDAKTIGQNPWSQSDSEFAQTVLQEVGSPIPNPNPAPNYGFGNRPVEASTAENVSKTFNTMLNAKVTTYLDKFLEIGEDAVKGLLHNGISHMAIAAVHKIPVADLIVDWVKEQLGDQAQARLIASYKTDRVRRLRLTDWHWGTYRDPDGARLPGSTDFAKQVVG